MPPDHPSDALIRPLWAESKGFQYIPYLEGSCSGYRLIYPIFADPTCRRRRSRYGSDRVARRERVAQSENECPRRRLRRPRRRRRCRTTTTATATASSSSLAAGRGGRSPDLSISGRRTPPMTIPPRLPPPPRRRVVAVVEDASVVFGHYTAGRSDSTTRGRIRTWATCSTAAHRGGGA